MIICVNDKSPLFLHSYFLYFVLCLWYRPSEPVWCDMNRVDLFPCHRYERRQILIFWLSLNNKVLLYLFLLLPGFLHAGYRQTVNINFTAVDVPFSLMAYEDTHVKYPPRTFFTQTRLSSLAKVWCWLWQRWIYFYLRGKKKKGKKRINFLGLFRIKEKFADVWHLGKQWSILAQPSHKWK